MKKRKVDDDSFEDERGDFMWFPGLVTGAVTSRWEPTKIRRLTVCFGMGPVLGPPLPLKHDRPSFAAVQLECDERNGGKIQALWKFVKRMALGSDDPTRAKDRTKEFVKAGLIVKTEPYRSFKSTPMSSLMTQQDFDRNYASPREERDGIETLIHQLSDVPGVEIE